MEEDNIVRFVSCTQDQYNSIYRNKDQNIEEQSDINEEENNE